MRHSIDAILMFSLHAACHCFLTAALIYLTHADFRGLYLYDWFSVESVAAFFASMSARSLPSIFACPNIHIISIYNYVSFTTSSMLSKIFLIIVCPDYLRGWSITFISTWLFVYMRPIWHLLWFHIYLIARYIAVSSIIYTLNSTSLPRCWWLTSFVTELYIAVSMLFSMPESFI